MPPHGLAGVVALATLALLVWGLVRPALWLDESASVVATQRSWPALWSMLGGSDAPLVPYYALLKVTTSAVTLVAPGTAAAPEVLFRWPSVAVTVLAAWALTLWLARRCPPPLALCTAGLLLALEPLSRYGQEARPYAFVLAAAVAGTILWSRLIRDGRRRWVLLYALAVAAIAAAHVLAASLVCAHLVAAAVTAGRENRRAAVLRTAGAAVLGLLVVSPLVLAAALNGQGTRPRLPMTPAQLPGAVGQAIGQNSTLALLVAAGLAVAGGAIVYAARTRSHTYRFIARLAVAWAVVPLVVLLPVMLVRPNLLKFRYVLFVLPGWAILGGLALVLIMDRVRRGLAHLMRRTDSIGSRSRGALTTAASYGVGALALAAVVGTQVDALQAIRAPGGHGEDIRPALATAAREEYAQLPIVFSFPNSALQLGAYARAEENRLTGLRIQRDQPSIWPKAAPTSQGDRDVPERLVLLWRAPSTGECRWSAKLSARAEDYIRRCLPQRLRDEGYQVEWAEAAGRRWASAVLTLRAPDS